MEALKLHCGCLSLLEEGGVSYLCLQRLRLPGGCTPPVCDGLLCPTERDGYPSRLFFSVRVNGAKDLNWNALEVRIGGRLWFAYSWKVEQPDLTLPQLLLHHLHGLQSP